MSASAFQSIKALLSPTAEQLMWRVRMQDDPEAFAELVRRWEGPIQRLCQRMIGDACRSQDLAQEVFARLFARRKAYSPGAKFSTYLWRVALNLCYDELRRARNRREVLLEDPEARAGAEPAELAGEEPGPAEALAREEAGAAVRRAVLALPEPYRAVVILRHYEDLKFREIAEVLGLPEGTVKTRMAEALNRLARRLRPALDISGGPALGPSSPNNKSVDPRAKPSICREGTQRTQRSPLFPASLRSLRSLAASFAGPSVLL